MKYDKAWVVTEILKGRVNRQDYVDGMVRYCEKCDAWEYKGALTYCTIKEAMDKAMNASGQTTEYYVSNGFYDYIVKQTYEGTKHQMELQNMIYEGDKYD